MEKKNGFHYNDEGILEFWEDGVKTGEIGTMGDMCTKEKEAEIKRQKERYRKKYEADSEEEWYSSINGEADEHGTGTWKSKEAEDDFKKRLEKFRKKHGE